MANITLGLVSSSMKSLHGSKHGTARRQDCPVIALRYLGSNLHHNQGLNNLEIGSIIMFWANTESDSGTRLVQGVIFTGHT